METVLFIVFIIAMILVIRRLGAGWTGLYTKAGTHAMSQAWAEKHTGRFTPYNSHGYIYIAEVRGNDLLNSLQSYNLYKIGFTLRDPQQRILEINKKMWNFGDLRILYCFEINKVYEVEQGMHQLLNIYKVYSEYYRCSIKEIAGAFYTAIQKEDSILMAPDKFENIEGKHINQIAMSTLRIIDRIMTRGNRAA